MLRRYSWPSFIFLGKVEVGVSGFYDGSSLVGVVCEGLESFVSFAAFVHEDVEGFVLVKIFAVLYVLIPLFAA